MRTGSYFKGTILGSWLMAAGVAYADDAATPGDHTPTLYGTAETLAHLAPLQKTLLDLTKMDTLVYSREALLRPGEDKELQLMQTLGVTLDSLFLLEEITERMRTFLKPFESVLPYSIEKSKTPSPFGFPDPSDVQLTVQFIFTVTGGASSMSFVNEKTGKPFCEITPPRLENTAENVFLELAQLPAHYAVPSINHIDYGDLSSFIYLHEAAHCGQERDTSSPLSTNIRKLAMETEADAMALDVLKNVIAAEKPDSYYSDIASAMRDARAIAAIRGGSHLFSDGADFATHSTYVYPPDAPPAFTYDASDVAVANKIINTAANVITGFSYGAPMAKSGNLQIAELLRERGVSIHNPLNFFGSVVNDFPTTIEIGREINQQQPGLHYGTILAVRDGIADMVERGERATDARPQTEWAKKILSLSLQMIDNYTDAVKRRTPALAQDPIAQIAYEKIKKKYAELVKENAGKAPVDTEDAPQADPLLQIMTSRQFLEYLERNKGSYAGIPPADDVPGPKPAAP